MEYDGQMDPECVPLCDALNALSDIETISSCSGHGSNPFRIWFTAKTLESLRPVLEMFCVGETGLWRIEVGGIKADDAIYFMLERKPSVPT
jgi:hypothetical protein